MDKSDFETRTFEIELGEQAWKRIERLLEASEHHDSVEDFIGELLDHVQQGVYRSGAWERHWLEQCIGPDPVQAAHDLDEDPL